MENLSFLSGSPLPAGAAVYSSGVNFSLFSRHACAVILEIFEKPEDSVPAYSYHLDPERNKTGDIWHVFVKGLKKDALYLYRTDGPFVPHEGMRFNAGNYLLDPYARGLANTECFTANFSGQTPPPYIDGDLALLSKQSAAQFPKCIAIDQDDFDWEGDRPLNYPLKDCIIYEAHIKGLSCHPQSPQEHKGTYQGIIESIPYLKKLGITSLELLPIHEFNENELTRINPRTGEKLKNYWGYSTIAFFAPKAAYACERNGSNPVLEFKRMVRELHKNGIEIILDIVFNHTAEGSEFGPTLSFRGLDNVIYYMLEDDVRYYRNYSGCGNTVNCNHPIVQTFILDCLRYWVTEMHVDGFRFDLGSILGRDQNGTLMENPPTLEHISEDPILRKTKIIAEAWDAGGAYQVGTFPGGRWAEWNDRFRDEVRLFWRGDIANARELATRVTGSADLYLDDGRKPFHSINFITSHDGFTLYDLLSYNHKHNEENGEDNRDGTDSNCSYNHGFEGATKNARIEGLRKQKAKNLLLTLLLSLGTPMLTAGDEVLRTQRGNNNPYCQDNEISWFDWSLTKKNADILAFVQKLIRLRKQHPVFLRSEFLTGSGSGGSYKRDISWYDPEGKTPDWCQPSSFLAYFLDGSKADTRAERDDNSFYIILNGGSFDVTATICPPPQGKKWYRLIDTSYTAEEDFMHPEQAPLLENQQKYVVLAASAVVLLLK
ncbi:MAG: glycogen debranching protein GlgX [Treponema sp.]